MWRSYFWAIALLDSTILWSLAGEPDSKPANAPQVEQLDDLLARFSMNRE